MADREIQVTREERIYLMASSLLACNPALKLEQVLFLSEKIVDVVMHVTELKTSVAAR